MKLLIKVFLLLSLPLAVSSNDNLPHKDFTIKQSYKLDNGNTIIIEQTEMNNVIGKKILKQISLTKYQQYGTS